MSGTNDTLNPQPLRARGGSFLHGPHRFLRDEAQGPEA